MTKSEARAWADSIAHGDLHWAYSDGWVAVYDAESDHTMLARLDSEKLRGVWSTHV